MSKGLKMKASYYVFHTLLRTLKGAYGDIFSTVWLLLDRLEAKD